MRNLAVVLLGISLLLAGAAGAQEKKEPGPPAQVAVERQRAQIVAKNVKLSDAEGEKFWPVYQTYRAEKNNLLGRSAKLLRQYRANAGKIDDAKALEMLRRMQKIRQKEFELRRAYVDRFAAVLPTRKVLRYYQVENRLEAIARFESTRVIQLER